MKSFWSRTIPRVFLFVLALVATTTLYAVITGVVVSPTVVGWGFTGAIAFVRRRFLDRKSVV